MIIRKLSLLSCLLAVFISTTSTQAEDTKIKNPWKQCGIGAMIFSDEDDSTLAAVSNIIWDLGTTAMTSKVSSPDTCERRQYAAAQFISTNHASLEIEAARGETQKTAAIAQLMGCSDSITQEFSQELRMKTQENMSSDVYLDLTQEQKVEQYFNHVNSLANGKFSQSCKA